MKPLSEGRKMFFSVMAVFLMNSVVFILFEDYDRRIYNIPFSEPSDWHFAMFAMVVMVGLGVLLNGYAHRMDQRILDQKNDARLQMRRELTQNIAHELKTPTSSILGYTETLLDNPQMDVEMRQQFISRCHAQAQRLTSLLRDISSLNRMEYAADQMQLMEVNIRKLVDDIVSETATAFERRSMHFDVQLPDELIVTGDSGLLYSVFRNLIDNSLIYAGEGTTVSLRAHGSGNKWYFTFADNGEGIPVEHLPRLFERFYRVDKGRSRMQGGTGLGLAIVKNAILLHGGYIDVLPANPGLRFDFTLRRAVAS